MNPSGLLTASWTPTSSWFEKAVLEALGRMNRGRLSLTLPSGRVVYFGQDKGDLTEIHATLQVHSPEFFKRCVLYGDIGFGESYTDGEWETDNLTQLIRWMILNYETNPVMSGSKVSNVLLGGLRGLNRLRHALRDNDVDGSVRNISEHYDLSNEMFATFLDASMMYSCADFSGGAKSLEEAQIAKLDRLARALRLRDKDHVLEIGGGWGACALHLAQKYGCRVTTITVSKEQLRVIEEKIRTAGLSDRIEARFQDYRSVQGQFDKVISIEMLEAVGHKNLPVFYGVVERCLKPHGLLGVQVITCADSRYPQLRRGVDWTQKHIFPGSLIPSLAALTEASQRSSRLQLFSLHDLGTDYARTLAEWRGRFNTNLERIKGLGFDDRFVRAWNYYFAYCEAAFAMRHISVVQSIYTRPNNYQL
jgi:cyclopropane-fatty-acyl-phospholipid synthase